MTEMPEEPELVPVGEPDPLAAAPDPAPETDPLAQTAAEIAQIDVDAPRVAIVAADQEDLVVLHRAETELKRRDVSAEVRVMSADEAPRTVAEYTENAQLRGIRVIIAGAGPAARLATLITAHTGLPVIGVPLTSQGGEPGALDGLLARHSDREEPVAWVGLDDAIAAAALAVRVLRA